MPQKRVNLGLRAKPGDAEARELARVALPVSSLAAECERDQGVVATDDAAERLAVPVPQLLAQHDPASRPANEARQPDAARQVEPVVPGADEPGRPLALDDPGEAVERGPREAAERVAVEGDGVVGEDEPVAEVGERIRTVERLGAAACDHPGTVLSLPCCGRRATSTPTR